MPNKIPIDIILKRYIVNENDCWEYAGNKNKGGYGIVGHNSILIHRLSYEYYIGPIPKGLCVLHKCDNPACFNPKHLFLGTKVDNMRDRFNKGHNKLSSRKIVNIFNCKGKTFIEIGMMFNVSNKTAWNIKNLKLNYYKKFLESS